MGFDVRKYSKKRRTLFKELQLKWYVHKKRADRKQRELEEERKQEEIKRKEQAEAKKQDKTTDNSGCLLPCLLFLGFIFFCWHWEMSREDNYLFNRIFALPYYYSGSIRDGYIRVEGNYETRAINSHDTFFSSRVVGITCNIYQGNCVENGIQDMSSSQSGYYVPYLFDDYKIVSAKNGIVEAIRYTPSIEFVLTINTKLQQASVQQKPLRAKTGNALEDIGMTPCISTIVAPEAIFNNKKRIKYYCDFWNTPVRWLTHNYKLHYKKVN